MWVDVGERESLEPGQRYRAIFNIQAPYNSDLVAKVVGALRYGTGISSHVLSPLTGVTVNNVFVVAPTELVAGRNPYWSVGIEFTRNGTKVAPTSPRELKTEFVPVAGILILGVFAAILGIVLTVTIVTRRFQKDVVTPAVNLTQALVPLGILLVLVLFISRRGG